MKKTPKPQVSDATPEPVRAAAMGVNVATNSRQSTPHRSGEALGASSPPRAALGVVETVGDRHGPQSPRMALYGIPRLRAALRQVESTAVEVLADEAASEIERLREKLSFFSAQINSRAIK